MLKLLPLLLVLACPLGMLAMMAAPVLARRFARRADRPTVISPQPPTHPPAWSIPTSTSRPAPDAEQLLRRSDAAQDINAT
jgi:hypothetical protein